MRKSFLIAAVLIASNITPARALQTRTIDGTVSMGSGMGVIGDTTNEFTYAFAGTKGVRLLTDGCGVRMGMEVRCIVTFRAAGNDAVEILSARAPHVASKSAAFSGRSIGLPGSVFNTELCTSPQLAGNCRYVENANVFIERAGPSVAMVRYNQEIRFVSPQRVVVNCRGTDVSLRSVLMNSLPPGIKSCR